MKKLTLLATTAAMTLGTSPAMADFNPNEERGNGRNIEGKPLPKREWTKDQKEACLAGAGLSLISPPHPIWTPARAIGSCFVGAHLARPKKS